MGNPIRPNTGILVVAKMLRHDSRRDYSRLIASFVAQHRDSLAGTDTQVKSQSPVFKSDPVLGRGNSATFNSLASGLGTAT
ncbi:hypothetical protein MY3296_005551 [Beauveria thailandica]